MSKDLGPQKYFLGIEVARSPQGLFLCQRKYALDISSESRMLGAKPAGFPMEQNHRLTSEFGSPIADTSKYRRLVGRLLYLTITRSDLQYSTHILSQFMQDPRHEHWNAAMRLLCYLTFCPGQGIFLPASNPLHLQAYSDSDWASCPMTHRSVTGYLLKLGLAPISWKRKKRATVSCSSAEAEYRAMANATSEVIWTRNLFEVSWHFRDPYSSLL